MKKYLFMVGICVTSFFVHAQDEMSPTYQKEIDHPFNYTANGNEDGYSYAASGKEITVFNNQTGDVLWNKKFSEVSDQLRKVDDIISMWEAEVVFVFDRKIGKDKMACIDAKSGSLLWISEKFQDIDDAENIVYMPDLGAFAISTKEHLTMVKVKTGEQLWQTDKFKGVVADFVTLKDGSIVMLNMKKTLIGSLFAGLKNQIVRINSKNGDIIWDQTYRGVVEKKVLTRERIVDLRVEEDKVFLYMNGIQVFDYKDGKPLWAAVYDQTPSDIVKNKKPAGATKFGAYGVVAKPVIVGDYIYVLDLENKRNQFLKKYAIKSGKMVWRSAEIQDARAIPGIYVNGDKVILQVGGMVELQYQARKRNPDGSYEYENTIEYENIKPLNVQCFNAVTGEQLWESEKMKKGLTNLFLDGDNVIVCSGKALYSLDINTGKEKYEMPLKDDNVGLADYILDYGDQVIILGEKGVSSRKKSDGSYKASAKYKKSSVLKINGQIVFGDKYLALYTKSSDFAVYDLSSVKFKTFDARKGASAYLSDDGLSLYVFESGGMLRKSKVTKLSTK